MEQFHHHHQRGRQRPGPGTRVRGPQPHPQAAHSAQAATPRGVPVVYRLNMAEGQSFFIANNFMIQPDDVVYAPRSDSAEARKFFEFVQSITRVIYDVSVTSALNVN